MVSLHNAVPKRLMLICHSDTLQQGDKVQCFTLQQVEKRPSPHSFVLNQHDVKLPTPHCVTLQQDVKLPTPHCATLQQDVKLPIPHCATLQQDVKLPTPHCATLQQEQEQKVKQAISCHYSQLVLREKKIHHFVALKVTAPLCHEKSTYG